ncbi:hypothetical protein ACFVR2_04300 [Gottfriedia sp. NPDC057991]|uniref:hypothetical protein n=1 Tax=Gottfriedia sp. NPDC057991 TaxID=3346298 RepID=UPI0036DE0B59
MVHKKYWIIIFITLIVNVVMLQWTIESFYGENYEHVRLFSVIGVLSAIVCFLTYLEWRKKEYRK